MDKRRIRKELKLEKQKIKRIVVRFYGKRKLIFTKMDKFEWWAISKDVLWVT
jgi:hypothetical protein